MEYTFPDFCCVCLDPEPQSSWQLSAVEVGYDKKTGEDWTKETWIDVPMCDQCRRTLKARRYKLAAASIPIGAAAMGAWVWYWLKDDNLWETLGIGAAIAVLAVIFAYAILAAIFKTESHLEVGMISREGRITFVNKEYQKMFVQANREQ